MDFFKTLICIRISVVVFALVILFMDGGCLYAMDQVPEPRENPYYIRVLLLSSKKEARISLKGKYRISAFYTDETLLEGVNIKDAVCVPTTNGIRLNETEFKIFGLRLSSQERKPIVINNRAYWGNVDIIRQRDNTLSMVNHIDIEMYLRGVLRAEVPPWWPMEALKSQAIVARTFAIYQKQKNAEKDYDVRADTYSQVYGGADVERRRTNRAVAKTEDIVITYDNEIIPAFYHSCCGGHTEKVSNVWNMQHPSLGGVTCGFCKESPHFCWTYKIKFSQIEAALKKAGYNMGTLRGLEVTEFTESQRAKTVRAVTDKGEINIPANEFRLALDATKLKSTKFRFRLVEDIVVFEGNGWGHGIGFCQWGAYGQAMVGYKFEDILKHYYPGCEIMQIQ